MGPHPRDLWVRNPTNIDDAVEAREQLPIVGDDDDRGISRATVGEQGVDDVFSIHDVEVAGRLVAEHDLRPRDQRTAQGNPLPLAL